MAGPVKVTRADGTVTQQRAYTEREVKRVVVRGRQQPRTWNEGTPDRSGSGGGHDFDPP